METVKRKIKGKIKDIKDLKGTKRVYHIYQDELEDLINKKDKSFIINDELGFDVELVYIGSDEQV